MMSKRGFPRFISRNDNGTTFVVHTIYPKFIAEVSNQTTNVTPNDINILEEWDPIPESKIIGLKKAILKWLIFASKPYTITLKMPDVNMFNSDIN